jgi:hypothetical protein
MGAIFVHTRTATLLSKGAGQGAIHMLTPEIAELCKQASVEQNHDRLLYLITEINRLIAVRDNEPHKESAFTCERVPER